MTPDAKLGEVARGCRMTRSDASQGLDHLIVENLVRIRRPAPLARVLISPLVAFIVGAERYSLTNEGLWRVANDSDNEP
ncbi:MAG TPA: hypothetical protein VKO84_01595 [Gaiellaceae bacterium]|nr:hypothetical protein [Gaiellaceae bacterium]